MKTFCFNVEDAVKYGTEEAVILYHLRYWVATNQANGTNKRDGRVWSYNSYKGLAKLFPFFNEAKCRRLLDSLKDQGAILVANYNKSPYDRTNWYSVNDDSSICLDPKKDLADLPNGDGPVVRPIPITNQSHPITTISSQAKQSEKADSLKKSRRKDSYVPPTKEEFDKAFGDMSPVDKEHFKKYLGVRDENL